MHLFKKKLSILNTLHIESKDFLFKTKNGVDSTNGVRLELRIKAKNLLHALNIVEELGITDPEKYVRKLIPSVEFQQLKIPLQNILENTERLLSLLKKWKIINRSDQYKLPQEYKIIIADLYCAFGFCNPKFINLVTSPFSTSKWWRFNYYSDWHATENFRPIFGASDMRQHERLLWIYKSVVWVILEERDHDEKITYVSIPSGEIGRIFKNSIKDLTRHLEKTYYIASIKERFLLRRSLLNTKDPKPIKVDNETKKLINYEFDPREPNNILYPSPSPKQKRDNIPKKKQEREEVQTKAIYLINL